MASTVDDAKQQLIWFRKLDSMGLLTKEADIKQYRQLLDKHGPGELVAPTGIAANASKPRSVCQAAISIRSRESQSETASIPDTVQTIQSGPSQSYTALQNNGYDNEQQLAFAKMLRAEQRGSGAKVARPKRSSNTRPQSALQAKASSVAVVKDTKTPPRAPAAMIRSTTSHKLVKAEEKHVAPVVAQKIPLTNENQKPTPARMTTIPVENTTSPTKRAAGSDISPRNPKRLSLSSGPGGGEVNSTTLLTLQEQLYDAMKRLVVVEQFVELHALGGLEMTTPFMVNIQFPDGSEEGVQTRCNMHVNELIDRALLKKLPISHMGIAKLSFNGTLLGHFSYVGEHAFNVGSRLVLSFE